MLWLIEQLPETSAFTAACKGGVEHRGWTTTNVLLAGAFNALAAANYQRGNGKGKKPKPIEPPQVRRPRGAATGRSRAAAHIRRGIAAAKQYVSPDGPSDAPTGD